MSLLRRIVIVVATACSLTAPAGFAASAVKTPNFEKVKLANGATLLLMERHDVPLISFTAVIRGGALTDPEDRLGTASLTASLLEKGAGNRDANTFAETVASVGGSITTGASTESISVGGSFLARDQKLMVELLADVLQRPRLEQAQFETLRDRSIEFIRAAKDSDRSELTPIYGAASLFGAHPYGRSVGGSEASLAAIKHADVRQYYTDNFGADRVIIAVAGDFKTAQLKSLLSRAFANWGKAGKPLPTVPKQTEITARRVLLIDAPDAVQSYFWAGDVNVAKSDPRRASLDIVNTLFGGRFTSMLNTELRIRSGLSYGANSRFDRMAEGGSWELGSFTRTEKTIEAIDLALATLDQLHAGALEKAQLESAKSYVLGQYPLGLETASQWAYQLATLEFYGLDRSYIDDYGNQLAAVTLDDAKRVIDEVIPTSRQLVLVVIGKAEVIRDGLRKYGPLTEVKLSDPEFQTGQ
ncbi:M16 family metallopeptidase [Peristeroidobacter soli]|uniref:M16 family metallopeptidase n=1 Tax=Peristeroidobacter soli TaxID=2497877 RepID=UPI00101CF16E|nr:pitrilysin family protein [Peristeroidobacter soli]